MSILDYKTKVKGLEKYASEGFLGNAAGTGSISLPNARMHVMDSVKAYGKCEQNGTPTATTPVDIVCNNGAIKQVPYGSSIIDNTPDGQGTFVNPSSATRDRCYKAFGDISDGEYRIEISSGYEFLLQSKDKSTSSGTNLTGWITFCDYKIINTATLGYGLAIKKADETNFTPAQFNGTMSLKTIHTQTDGTKETIAIKDDTLTLSTGVCADLLSIGNFTDVQDLVSGAVTKKVGVRILNGTESWTYASSSAGTYFYARWNGLPIYRNSTNIISTHFANYSYNADNRIWHTDGASFINIRCDDLIGNIGNVNTFKTWLATQYAAGTPVIVVYPLATETSDTVSQQPMSTAQGNNTAEVTQASLTGLEIEAVWNRGK